MITTLDNKKLQEAINALLNYKGHLAEGAIADCLSKLLYEQISRIQTS